ncbi:glycoside hydrolase family 2 protein [Methylobacterium radiodurans]|uniref:Beta-mannosidase n=1 Tax=Methylobacterium radiodurans TaxID=2202828 RepID=A0A2U8VMT1_9HYPH|nr:glycoside hydrolase family 2 protein [Methylobacterium radiodurans]AWN34778.1 beta-mannosidase [Methylobacterium radiodurans]
MARIRAIDGVPPLPVGGSWQLVTTPPGACAGPGDLAGLDGWIPARVPGTAAAALREAGLWSEAEPAPIHDRDVWYRTSFPGTGRARLAFEGLATLCEVWLNGVPILTSHSMFRAHAVAVDLAGDNEIVLRFRSLKAELDRPAKRGRWRPRLATPGSLRHARTSLLGFMPGWCPEIDLVGPYRPITLTPLSAGAPDLVAADLRADLDGETGRLVARLRVDGPVERATLRCDGRLVALARTAPDLFEGELLLPGIAPWWPHTHGEPRLHAVAVDLDGRSHDLGRTGFRSITLTRPFEEGLSLAVNGVPVFCRGANWTPPDLVGLGSGAEDARPLLDLAREAGMNMLRVSGITLYGPQAFHDLCDELGILVFQDLMLANFDYPHDDPAFRQELEGEIADLLDRTQLSPSLCALSGGSEVWQQAAMLGAPRAVWADAFAGERLPALAAPIRPDLAVVPNSPSGGDLPFSTTAGVTHYYGVGAYRRPLEDARRAEVGFATECLAFANLPEESSLAAMGLGEMESPRWSAGIPRDRGADWDFEQVRDHYVGLLYGVDPAALRRADPERYRDLGRAAVAEVMEATVAEWRRTRSTTRGGLVWFLRDLAPGTGWGIVDARGVPKSGWYALKRAFRPVQVTLSDEGLNGLHVHLHNETAEARDLTLRLAFTDAAGRAVAKAERAVGLGARSTRTLSSAELLGRFFDATDSYRFGPPAHTLGHASLSDPAGAVIAEAFHVPGGRRIEPIETGLSVAVEANAIRVRAERHALGVQVEAERARPDDTWFHLAPGTERRIGFTGAPRLPHGRVRALNAVETVTFGPEA